MGNAAHAVMLNNYNVSQLQSVCRMTGVKITSAAAYHHAADCPASRLSKNYSTKAGESCMKVKQEKNLKARTTKK